MMYDCECFEITNGWQLRNFCLFLRLKKEPLLGCVKSAYCSVLECDIPIIQTDGVIKCEEWQYTKALIEVI